MCVTLLELTKQAKTDNWRLGSNTQEVAEPGCTKAASMPKKLCTWTSF